MKSILTLLIITLTASCFGQGYSLKEFVEVPPSHDQRLQWFKLSRSNKIFKTEVIKGKLRITDGPLSDLAEFTLPYGKLCAINLGEFGGSLYYHPNDTTLKVVKINGESVDTLKDSWRKYYAGFQNAETKKNKLSHRQFRIYGGNIEAFFKYKDSLYFVEGLAHMGENSGAIYKVDLSKDGGTITKVLMLNDAPQSILVSGDFIFLATFDSFFVFKNWKKEMELKKLFWEGLYPCSLAMMDKNTFYTAVYGGYAKIDLKQGKITPYRYMGTKQ